MNKIIEKTNTCCFTGHRPAKLPWGGDESDPRCIEMKSRLRDCVLTAWEEGFRHYICGMADGCDLFFAEAVLELRDAHEDVTLEAAMPYAGQADRWQQPQRRRYGRILERCDFHTLVQQQYTPDCMMRRNRYMVDASSLLIAVYNGSAGGTRNTMLYAMRQDVQIIELPV